jgi:hypothetical protein
VVGIFGRSIFPAPSSFIGTMGICKDSREMINVRESWGRSSRAESEWPGGLANSEACGGAALQELMNG